MKDFLKYVGEREKLEQNLNTKTNELTGITWKPRSTSMFCLNSLIWSSQPPPFPEYMSLWSRRGSRFDLSYQRKFQWDMKFWWKCFKNIYRGILTLLSINTKNLLSKITIIFYLNLRIWLDFTPVKIMWCKFDYHEIDFLTKFFGKKISIYQWRFVPL